MKKGGLALRREIHETLATIRLAAHPRPVACEDRVKTEREQSGALYACLASKHAAYNCIAEATTSAFRVEVMNSIYHCGARLPSFSSVLSESLYFAREREITCVDKS